MLKVGLTGGIGSGKSFVAEIFSHLDIPIYNADERAKQLMLSEEVRSQVQKTFGEESYIDGQLNRAFLADRVFHNSVELEKLNAIVHPAVRKDFLHWHNEQKAPYTVREAAILHESGAYVDCDKIIVVTAPDELRIKRVMDRDQISREDVLARMKNQWSQEKKVKASDFSITNDGEHMLLSQVLELHRKFLDLV